MKITQVRNATLIIEYGGKKFLVDPMLAEKGAYPGFEGSHNSNIRNPTVELPLPIEEIVKVDAVIVTHTHSDHWDDAAKTAIPRALPIFVQNAKDADLISSAGFADVRVLSEHSEFEGVSLAKTPGQHGTDAAYQIIGEILGEVCGVVFTHSAEKTTYLVGDSIWNDYVRDSLAKYKPEVIILNSGDGYFNGLDPILMGKDDVLTVANAAPGTKLLATHMEGVNLTRLSRQELRDFAVEKGFSERLVIPADGEISSF